MTSNPNRSSFMKLNVLIASVLLGTTLLSQAQKNEPGIKPVAQAQAKPVPLAPKAGGVKNPNPNADGSISLPAGFLSEVVAEIERRIPYWTQKAADGDTTMPNVIFGAGTEDAQLANLTLRGVTPVQALTLVATAAGCVLEPVVAVREQWDYSNNPGQIIGYRFVLDGGSGTSKAKLF